MILAVLCHYDPYKTYFSCGSCGTEEKKQRGCKRNRRTNVVSGIACICGGELKCEVCNGAGSFSYKRCPQSVFADYSIVRLCQYFFHWKSTEYMQFPDGRGRYFQPSIMLDAFSIMARVSDRKDEERIKSISMSGGKNG